MQDNVAGSLDKAASRPVISSDRGKAERHIKREIFAA